ncbi:3-phenylpropionate/trans-cinnamate dioxygenase ferredoxin subunit [Burkholderia sp. WP9]|jgi:3-phenylpropionate/trans-cinnamate dioxygenase ferredoxin subunit|uniref:Rieske (2Fe-2S) protein n=1 Tax=Burkholderiaceae TaxID=119060 RepID=UPI00089C6039|nr:Rieske 2Fe-2S domain-containing protein [Burkholderia sp. WP9]SEC76733.1 3-phenylpropionate/trans-cinnamate dioxygenase ferredoxin subunit [Burkholderia sp. WP9]
MSRQIPVGAVDELAPGQRKLAFVDGRSIVLFNIAGTVHAIDNACPHNSASLASGRLDGCVLSCPAHGLRFDLRTGRMPGAGGLSLTTFPVRATDGKLLVCLEDPLISTVQAPACDAAARHAPVSDAVTTQLHSSNKP